jgi:hypothetical protein
VWYHAPIILELRKSRHEDHKFKEGLDYIVGIFPKGGKEEKKRGREGRRKIGGEERRLDGGRGGEQ